VPWADVARQVRALNDQMVAATRAMAVAAARGTPPAMNAPMARYSEELLAATSALSAPLRELLDENTKLVERIERWSEHHRDMAEQMAAWAERQRLLTDQMAELARPFLSRVDALEELHAIWSDAAGAEGGPTAER
jgi:hypothetical protein